MSKTVLVIVPYRTDIDFNYAYAAYGHSLDLGEVPFVPVLHYTDGGSAGRISIPSLDLKQASLDWLASGIENVVFYMDLGMTNDMKHIDEEAQVLNKKIEYRYF